MKALIFVLVTLAGVACSSSPAVEQTLGADLTYVVPSGWSSKDFSNHQRAMFEWTPPSDDNEHKESIVVLRTERAALAKSEGNRITRLLEDAQNNLPGGTFGRPTQVATRFGLGADLLEPRKADRFRTVDRCGSVRIDRSQVACAA